MSHPVSAEDRALLDAYRVDQERRGLQPTTIEQRELQLSLFASQCGPLAEVQPQRIEEWLDTRRNRQGDPISGKTRSCWLTTIAALYDWAIRVDRLTVNPVKKIVRPRLHPRGPRPISEKALARALDAASGVLKCWITIEALEGLRCQEVAYLAAEDVDRDRMTLFVSRGKGGKERRLPLHPDVVRVLDETPGLPTWGRLWPDANPSKVSQRINRHLRRLGIKDTAHSLRHHFGTRVYKQSKDLRLTQSLMGHSSPQTTAGYADFDQDQALGVVSGIKIGG